MGTDSEHLIEQIIEALDGLRTSIAVLEDKLSLLVVKDTVASEEEIALEEETAIAEMPAFDISLDDSDAIAASVVEEAVAVSDIPDEEPASDNVEDIPEEMVVAEAADADVETEEIPVDEEVAVEEIPVGGQTQTLDESEIVAAAPEADDVASAVEEVEIPVDDVHDEEGDDDAGFFAPLEEPAPVLECINDEASTKVKPALMDVLAGKHAWRTDVPGLQVHNILSAISLNDRVLFINTLFGEDPLSFQETVTYFNSLEDFSGVEQYVSEHFSHWKLDSEPVYRFMMAVRRKLG